jgi:tetratricopeptide (TPR) repeat protein
MAITQKQISFIIFPVFLLVLFFFLFRYEKEGTLRSGDRSGESTTTTLLPEDREEQKNNGYAIEMLPSHTAPSLPRNTVFKENLSKEARDILKKNIDTITLELQKNSAQPQGWVNLGLNYKIAGDYEGARLAWEYAQTLSPGWVVPYSNLADLYHYYLPNYPASEGAWQKVIALEPKQAEGYIELAKLYEFSYTAKSSLVVPTLTQGIQNNPSNPTLRVALAHYYRSQGQTEKAKQEYQEAITLFKKTNDLSQVSSLEEIMVTL